MFYRAVAGRVHYNPRMENLSLFARLARDVADWRKAGYVSAGYPLIGEILSFQTRTQAGSATLQYLREPQFFALEVYWYVRLVLQTPHVIDLYRHYFGSDKKDFFDALGVSISRDALAFAEIDDVIERIRTNEQFVRDKKIQALHEAAALAYPSYILALAMGAGKTVLIGTIVATEFALSLRYPHGNFMKNALVFAPGTTIIESLRELAGMPFEQILPPDLCRDFLANLKIEYPGNGKDISVQSASAYNLIVTNTEKISLRVKRRANQQQEVFDRKEVEANLRLQKIAGLPSLGVFSDEAHHTYGNTFAKLKRVRETINYIHQATTIVAVVNTTGTPYYKRQPLKEVIVWYGLADGIRDNILKHLRDGIHQYDIGAQSEEEVFNDIIREFFTHYGNVAMPDGAQAKIAFYFKTQEHLDASRRLIEQAMTAAGENVAQILINTQQSGKAEIDEFKRLNNPANQKRVILLIGKGVEGWNCPSLFACALIKEQTTSNNYVLQAATRCLRQVPGNAHSARIFLDAANARILDRELQDNFGTDLDRISASAAEKETVTLRILKTELPKLEITRTLKKVIRKARPNESITLHKPKAQALPAALRHVLTADFSGPGEILMPTGETTALPAGERVTDCHTAAWKISRRYHRPVMTILQTLRNLYPQGEVPSSHLYDLFQQIEQQQANYTTIAEKVTEALALIRLRDENGAEVFEKDKDNHYVHRLRILKRTHEHMIANDLLAEQGAYEDRHDLSFHYTPYNFDSQPERSFFRQILASLNTNSDEVETFLFTGGLTDPKKTDFHFEYLGEDKRYHRYFPDFVMVKKTGEFYIIEVKAESERGDKTVEAKRKAVERLQKMQRDKFRYHVVYAGASTINNDKLKPVWDWVRYDWTDSR